MTTYLGETRERQVRALRLADAREDVVAALEEIKSIAALHRVASKPGRLTAMEATEHIVAIADAALKELEEASK